MKCQSKAKWYQLSAHVIHPQHVRFFCVKSNLHYVTLVEFFACNTWATLCRTMTMQLPACIFIAMNRQTDRQTDRRGRWLQHRPGHRCHLLACHENLLFTRRCTPVASFSQISFHSPSMSVVSIHNSEQIALKSYLKEAKNYHQTQNMQQLNAIKRETNDSHIVCG